MNSLDKQREKYGGKSITKISWEIEKVGHSWSVRLAFFMIPKVLTHEPSHWTTPFSKGSYLKPSWFTILLGMIELVALLSTVQLCTKLFPIIS